VLIAGIPAREIVRRADLPVESVWGTNESITRRLNKQISALDPIDMLNDQIWAAAHKLLRAVHDLIQAHG
jgi:hypothetical protein